MSKILEFFSIKSFKTAFCRFCSYVDYMNKEQWTIIAICAILYMFVPIVTLMIMSAYGLYAAIKRYETK